MAVLTFFAISHQATQNALACTHKHGAYDVKKQQRGSGLTLPQGAVGEPPGARLRCAKWMTYSEPQGRPPKGTNAQPSAPEAGRRCRTTPECHSASYNPVRGPVWYYFGTPGSTGKLICHHLSPLGLPKGGSPPPPAAPSPLGTPKPPAAQFRGAKRAFQSRVQGRPPKGSR